MGLKHNNYKSYTTFNSSVVFPCQFQRLMRIILMSLIFLCGLTLHACDLLYLERSCRENRCTVCAAQTAISPSAPASRKPTTLPVAN